ncbi:MAG: helix-turn-helix domain-containing protein [Candidatus Thermoplasmatota archaeon]
MDRLRLIERVRGILRKAEFDISEPFVSRGFSFDLVARGGEFVLIVKAMLNIDALREETAIDLKALASSLNAKALVVATHTSRGRLEAGVLYRRHRVPVMCPETVSDLFLEGVPPYVFAASGGYYARLDGALLRNARFGRHSIKDLAEQAGVSRRAVQMYEEGMGAMLDAAIRLEEFLGIPLIVPLDPFSETECVEDLRPPVTGMTALESEVCASLGRIGYKVMLTPRCPFDALTKERAVTYFAAIGKREARLIDKVRATGKVARVSGQDSIVFTDVAWRKGCVEGAPVVSKRELERIADPHDLIALINERKRGSP